jgi:hypothetical protein
MSTKQQSNNPVKTAYTKSTYTADQIEELRKCISDPIYFIETYMRVRHPVKGNIPFKLYPYQKEIIGLYKDYRSVILLTGRQMGKTETTVGFLLWFAMFNQDSTILVAGNVYRAALEIMKRVRYVYEQLPDWLKAGVIKYARESVEFDNGSTILSQATTENTGRGLSLSILYVDEFAFVQPRLAEEFWTSISPTLSTGGKCFITSTPNSDEDTFASIWREAENTLDQYGNEHPRKIGKNGFRALKAAWHNHPERDQDWADEQIGKVGEERFRREHNCVVGTTTVYLQDPDGDDVVATMRELHHDLALGTLAEPGDIVPNRGYTVLTPSGYQEFAGISLMGHREIWRVVLADGSDIECSDDHKFFNGSGERLALRSLDVGDLIQTRSGLQPITTIENTRRVEPVYDLIEVSRGHCYLTNSIVSSNCEFIAADETLINGIVLAGLQGVEPLRKTGEIRWYKDLEPNRTYLVGMDPCSGVNRDHSAIQVFQLPELEQVAEWRDNRTDIRGQITMLHTILTAVHSGLKQNPKQQGTPEIYWTLENNSGYGDAALLVINDTGEEKFPGEFVHEIRRPGATRSRKGMNTNVKTKVSSCVRLKSLIETKRFRIYSKALTRELKFFVSKGQSFAAKQGETDDLISACLLVVRMMEAVQRWDDDFSDMLKEVIEMDDMIEEPMPFAMVFG